ncbi:MAG: hypothetical protein H7257_12250 [Taibaiella sp.]|nr:hypothetical protein [Taibaiella sp.]
MKNDWNKQLENFILPFYYAKNALDYQFACTKLVVSIQDAHADIWLGAKKIDSFKGDYYTPFRVSFIENQLVVTGYYDDSSTLFIKNKIFVGNVIESMNGLTVDSLVKTYLPLTSGANLKGQLFNLAKSKGYLMRGRTPDLQIVLKRFNERKTVSVTRQQSPYDSDWDLFTGNRIINGNIGYIYAAHLNPKDLNILKNAIRMPRV